MLANQIACMQNKKSYLLGLEKGDLLVFYVGLKPFQTDNYEKALYLIGYFTVEKVLDLSQMSNREIEEYSKLYPNNAHIKHNLGTDVRIVIGKKAKSNLLEKAIRLSEPKPDKSDRKYPAVSDAMEKLLGIKGFVHKSSPPKVITKAKYVENLKRILNYTDP